MDDRTRFPGVFPLTIIIYDVASHTSIGHTTPRHHEMLQNRENSRPDQKDSAEQAHDRQADAFLDDKAGNRAVAVRGANNLDMIGGMIRAHAAAELAAAGDLTTCRHQALLHWGRRHDAR